LFDSVKHKTPSVRLGLKKMFGAEKMFRTKKCLGLKNV